jgi:hypothetical protein
MPLGYFEFLSFFPLENDRNQLKKTTFVWTTKDCFDVIQKTLRSSNIKRGLLESIPRRSMMFPAFERTNPMARPRGFSSDRLQVFAS